MEYTHLERVRLYGRNPGSSFCTILTGSHTTTSTLLPNITCMGGRQRGQGGRGGERRGGERRGGERRGEEGRGGERIERGDEGRRGIGGRQGGGETVMSQCTWCD